MSTRLASEGQSASATNELTRSLNKVSENLGKLNPTDKQKLTYLLDVDETLNVKEFRRRLYILQAELNTLSVQKAARDSREAVYAALVVLAHWYPLNQKDSHGRNICPLSFDVIRKDDTTTPLSNGYVYMSSALRRQAQVSRYIPRKLGNVQHDITDRDVDVSINHNASASLASAGSRIGLFLGGIVVAITIGAVPASVYASVGATITALLLTLGMTAAAAAGVLIAMTVGAIILPLVVVAIVGGLAGKLIYDNHYKAKLAPASSPAADESQSSESKLDTTAKLMKKEVAPRVVNDATPVVTVEASPSAALTPIYPILKSDTVDEKKEMTIRR
jgi:hypothetical protein